ncbi:uncharacterized protein TrAtP1_003362 [Trichoderma atroviride]|uniref:uncharacterized protein n=1 Tax=Hypocrea atroviridis TaxID=63577 RepID=UPI0033333708|nr:hypothetical protein TrAtP1_003362 [Trichoderma atroviride]
MGRDFAGDGGKRLDEGAGMPSAGLRNPSMAAALQRTRDQLKADGTRPRLMLADVPVDSYGRYTPKLMSEDWLTLGSGRSTSTGSSTITIGLLMQLVASTLIAVLGGSGRACTVSAVIQPPVIITIIAAFVINAVICNAASRTTCIKTASPAAAAEAVKGGAPLTATPGHNCGTQHLCAGPLVPEQTASA